jgi:GABA permease
MEYMIPTAPTQLLVVANETADSRVLVQAVRDIALARDADVLVVAPALNSRLRHWMSDSDGAHHAAALRLAACLDGLLAAGVRATGEVGDADPMHAIEDAMSVFPAAEILISTHPEGRSNWLARDIVARACARFDVPVVHLVDGQATPAVSPPCAASAPHPAAGQRR